MKKESKAFHCTENTMTVYYEDSKKHFFYEYENSPIENIQLHGNNFKGVQFQDDATDNIEESIILSEYQNKLYKDALHGLSNYSLSQLKVMSDVEKSKIARLHSRTNRILNTWKQTILNAEVDDFLQFLFPKSTFITALVEKTKNYTDANLKVPITLTELGINKKQIIGRLIQEKVLPLSFYNN